MKASIVSLAALFVMVLGSSSAHAEDAARISTVNMPPGWTWPPSAAMDESRTRCLAELTASGVRFERAKKPVGKINTPVVVPSMRFGALEVVPVYEKRAPVMDCQLALSLVQHAEVLATAGVRTLVVAGFHTERRARLHGRSLNIMSRHSLGLAVDIRGFVTHTGQTLTVLRDYAHPLVQRVESALKATGGFRAVVTPGNDPAHQNHFHLSAKMTIDSAHPDPSVEVAELLAQTAPPRSRPRYASLQGSSTVGARRAPRHGQARRAARAPGETTHAR